MASARKKAAPSRAHKKSKPAPKRRPAKAKPAARKPAARKPVAKKSAARKPAAKKPAAKKPAAKRPVPAKKPVAKKPVAKKPVPVKKVAAKVIAKGAAHKGGKPAPPAKGAALKAGKPVPAKPVAKVKAKPPRLVPVTAEARAAAAAAARASRPGVKGRQANRPEPEVRPLGVLPLSAQVKPRGVPPRRPAPPRSLTPPSGTPKQQVVRKGDDRLTQDDLKYFEQRLLTERRRIMAEMGHLEATVLKVNPRDAEGEQSGYSYHMADAGTDSMEREKAFDIASKEGRLLLEIDEALRRLYSGNYGICEISGKPISRTRLDALPWARLSIDEQEKLEKEKRLGRLTAPEKE